MPRTTAIQNGVGKSFIVLNTRGQGREVTQDKLEVLFSFEGSVDNLPTSYKRGKPAKCKNPPPTYKT